MVILARATTDKRAARLLQAVSALPSAQAIAAGIEEGRALLVRGISEGARSFFAAMLKQRFPGRVVLVVCAGTKQQEQIHDELQAWQRLVEGENEPLFFPSWEVLPHESRLPHADVISERLETLIALRKAPEAGGIVVASVASLLQKTFPPEYILEHTRTVAKGAQIDPLDLVEWLEEQGYEPEAQVTQKGEIALRGGVLDIFPITSPWPVRLDFFGEDLDSLRYFDPTTQVSRETLAEVVLPPAGELGILKKLPENHGSLLDYLPAGTITVFLDKETLDLQAATNSQQHSADDPLFLNWEQTNDLLSEKGATLDVSSLEVFEAGSELVLELKSLDPYRRMETQFAELQIIEAERKEFFAQIHRWRRQSYSVQVFCSTPGEKERVEELWKEYGYDAAEGPLIFVGALHQGFICDEARLVVLTDNEIFGRRKQQRSRRMRSPHAAATKSAFEINFTELEEGDFVVHVNYGIGRYLGLQKLKKGKENEEEEEFLAIEYAPSRPEEPAPKLYVPVTEAHLVSKYVGAGKARPQLNTLTGQRWAKAKEQAERAVRDLTSELLSIQAARESQEGYSFSTDTTWQREFETSFPFQETVDQLKAIAETKGDMERPKPMDRLICGDVGFGKTEVAIRAAFKAVMSGKQVALLVPTTVLAQQHFNTFRERMAGYPIKVDLLSRFRTKREQNKVLQALANGGVDIVIGTHRLVQTDVKFKDLGLVIIDEEQRFGVLHKERFKMLRKLVDVLTLSATPIPRTLYLALTGARDMSTIETPPQDRLPVETIITQYDERVIRDAIQRELNRDGQVFYLHNRVFDIEGVALKLRTLLPQAHIVVGHGQMDPDQLEEVMTKFVNGEADVLLSTTIIESGVDIPNANTIIIDRADRFGLSDLYQLRGRVGRYKHQAYAYFLLPRHAALLSDARKRISAIKQYSTLGSGFKIAMRDLEIRGAGNLLGAQQSGHITAVGFELYCQLLKQSVSAAKGEKVQTRINTQVKLDFIGTSEAETEEPKKPDLDIKIPRSVAENISQPVEKKEKQQKATAGLPISYVPSPQHRIDLYRKLAQANEKRDLDSLKSELRDRFGPIPEPVDLLLQIAELKIIAAQKNVSVIETKEGKLMITRNNDYLMMGNKFPRLSKKDPKGRLKEIKKLLVSLS